MSSKKDAPKKFSIIRDTREQTPWEFKENEFCSGSIDEKVEHGDYSIEGLEDLIFIERKASVQEVAQNIIEPRFEKLLLASEKYRYRYIVCEFPFSQIVNYPYGSGLPKKVVSKIRIKGNFILSKLQDYQIEHGINIVFCDNKSYAQRFVLHLLKKIYNREAPC